MFKKKKRHFSLILSVSNFEYIHKESSETGWSFEWFTYLYNHKTHETFRPILYTAGPALLLPKTLKRL